MATASRGRAKSPAQTFALVFGIVYVAVGILGFAVTGFDNFFNSSANDVLIVFPVNPAHNIVHLLIGAAWIGGSRAYQPAKAVNTGVGAAYLLVFLLGLFGALEWLSIESGVNADQLLHLVSGGLSVYFGTAGAGDRSAATV
ncbi:MAG: DUF4383 domain-containing protein [Actinomycetota bacterium]